MYLSRVDVCNFRSLHKLRVELQPGLNALVGRNNTGKTNLLHAIRHALGPSASRGDQLWLDHDDFYKESPTDTTDRTIGVTLTFSDLSPQQRSYFYEIVDFDLNDTAKSTAIIRFEARWSEKARRPLTKRTGGPPTVDAPEVPSRLLEALSVTFLPALRDAEAALTPGVRSRLARLLRELAERREGESRDDILRIYEDANKELERRPLIKETKKSLQRTTRDLAGSDYAASSIKAAPADFDRILRSLHIQMETSPIGGLDANGLGYNNLLYMAVILEHLKSPLGDESPLLLVEEPEAHLHPQLTMLLADYLAHKTPGNRTPQTIVTTHSPTLAAALPPSRIHVLFAGAGLSKTSCNSLARVGMDEREETELQRMMDITRATLYFAKAAIVVEGVCEALLVPVLAERLGHDLRRLHISVLPICGVAFPTLKKLLDPLGLGIPVAIVSDGDPQIVRGTTWESDAPQRGEDGEVESGARIRKLIGVFSGHPNVKVLHSKVTLEYDLAEAGDGNAAVMAREWSSCFSGMPGTFNETRLSNAGTNLSDKALVAWRGICRAEHSGSKAEFIHRLATQLAERDDEGQFVTEFSIPTYLEQAIEHVVTSIRTSSATGDTEEDENSD